MLLLRTILVTYILVNINGPLHLLKHLAENTKYSLIVKHVILKGIRDLVIWFVTVHTINIIFIYRKTRNIIT